MDFLHKIKAVVVLDNAGNRIFCKYFPTDLDPSKRGDTGLVAGSQWASLDKQRSLEATMHRKSRGAGVVSNGYADGDVMVVDDLAIVYDAQQEVSFFIVGDASENILILSGVLSCLVESLQELLKCHGAVDRRTLLENYDILILVVDEMIDDGVIFEIASSAVVGEITPFLTDNSGADGAKKALGAFGKYIKQNL